MPTLQGDPGDPQVTHLQALDDAHEAFSDQCWHPGSEHRNPEGNNEVGLQHYYMEIQRREYNLI